VAREARLTAVAAPRVDRIGEHVEETAMRRAFLAVFLLAPVVQAREILPPLFHFFFTTAATQPYGLSLDANAFDPIKGAGRDVTDGHYFVDAFQPATIGSDVTPEINWAAGEFACLWFRFRDVSSVTKVQGANADLDGVPTEVAYYVVDDTQGDIGMTRWDGLPGPNDLNFKQDPQILADVGAFGLVARTNTTASWNLYDNLTRTALVGAVRYESDGLRSLAYGSFGLAVRGLPLQITLERSVFGAANWTPEPGCLAALSVGALLLLRGRPRGD
jgi:hypothetical protein